METINQYQHVRLRPGMYGLHDNYFNKIFHQCILDLLHEFSFTTLKISTVPERNEVIFEASEREKYHAANNYWSFILIAGISSFAKFSAEFKDGSFRRTIIKEAEPCEETFGIYHSPGRLDESSGFYPNTDLERLELRFILPKEFPIDDNYACSKVHDLSKIFPHSRITYNGNDLDFSHRRNRNKNKITSILQYGHVLIEPARNIYEFSADSEDISWEVSFTFDYAEKRRISFINGIWTARGGMHADCITRVIEQVFRKTEKLQENDLNNLSFVLSVHLPPEKEIYFDRCRCGTDLRLESEYPEFKLMERNLKSQIIKYLSKEAERGAK